MISLIALIAVFLGRLPLFFELGELYEKEKTDGLYEDEAERKRELTRWMWSRMAILAVCFAVDGLFLWQLF